MIVLIDVCTYFCSAGRQIQVLETVERVSRWPCGARVPASPCPLGPSDFDASESSEQHDCQVLCVLMCFCIADKFI